MRDRVLSAHGGLGRSLVAGTAVALVTAVTLAILDLGLDLLTRPGALRGVGEALAVTGAASALLAMALLPAALVAVWLCRRQGRSPWPLLQVGVAVASAVFAYVIYNDMLRSSVGTSQVVSALGFATIVLLAAWALVTATRPWPQLRVGRALIALALLVHFAVWGTVANHLRADDSRNSNPEPRIAEVGTGPAPDRAAGDAPPVILLSIDTLRADDLSLYATDGVPVPALEALAADSYLYERAYSPAPWTLPAMLSLHTGVSPQVHRATRAGRGLPAAVPTLASWLESAGYRTAAIGYNPHLVPLAAGFQEHSFYPRPPSLTLGAKILRRRGDERFEPRPGTPRLSAEARHWLRGAPHQSFFLWLHYFDPHAPYRIHHRYLPPGTLPELLIGGFDDENAVRTGHLVPTPEERRWLHDVYRAEIRHVDEHLATVLGLLRELDLYERSLIVLTSDHGEEFWEHDGFLHGHTVYEELLRVPLLVKPPAGAATEVPRRFAQPVSTQAVFNTVLDWLGVEPPDLPAPEPVLPPRGPTDGRPPIFASGLNYYEDRTAVVSDDHKYVVRHESRQEELYDLLADPGEQETLLLDDPAAAAPYRRMVATENARTALQRRHLGLTGDGTGAALDPALEDELRSLGYLR